MRSHNRSLTRAEALVASKLAANADVVYYTTDSHTIIMGGNEYSRTEIENLDGYFTEKDAEFIVRPTAGSLDVAEQDNSDTATIKGIKGNTIVWNQLAPELVSGNWKALASDATIEFIETNNVKVATVTNPTATDGINFGMYCNADGLQNHLYYWQADIMPSVDSKFQMGSGGAGALVYTASTTTANVWNRCSGTSKYIAADFNTFRLRTSSAVEAGSTVQFRNVQVYDLSLMFGLGNEPTYAEFKAYLEKYFPRHDYAYNEGELLNVNPSGIKTVGFNIWDWKNYNYSEVSSRGTVQKTDTGLVLTQTADGVQPLVNRTYMSFTPTSSGAARNLPTDTSGDLIPVLPNTTYQVTFDFSTTSAANVTGRIGFLYLDKNGYMLPHPTNPTTYFNYNLITSGSTFTTPNDCYYIQVWFSVGNYSDTKTGDTYTWSNICLHQVWSGKRNGEYEEYWEEETPIDITSIQGTKEDGTKEVIFPDGLKGIGDYKDEIIGNKAIKRIGKVDLGSLNWIGMSDSTNRFQARFTSVPRFKSGNIDNIVCSKYPTSSLNSFANQEPHTIRNAFSDNIYVYVNDTSYTDAATFKAAMQGVYAYYVLAEPVEYTLDTEFRVDYKVDDYGTEQVLPDNGTEPTTMPIIADIQYGINAVDSISNLDKNYVGTYSQNLTDGQKEQARKNIGVDDVIKAENFDFYTEAISPNDVELAIDAYSLKDDKNIGGGARIPSATTTAAGVMSAADKAKLDGLNVGVTPGKIVQLITAPSYNDSSLAAYGYDVGTTDDIQGYYKAVVRWLCATYPKTSNATFIGRGKPSSVQIFIIYVYNTSDLDAETGLPKSSMGMLVSYTSVNSTGGIHRFGTSNYQWLWDTALMTSQVRTALTTTSNNPIAAAVVSAAIQTLQNERLKGVKVVDGNASVSSNIATIPKSTESVWGVVKLLQSSLPIPGGDTEGMTASVHLLYGLFQQFYNAIYGSLPSAMNAIALPTDPTTVGSPTDMQKASVLYRIGQRKVLREITAVVENGTIRVDGAAELIAAGYKPVLFKWSTKKRRYGNKATGKHEDGSIIKGWNRYLYEGVAKFYAVTATGASVNFNKNKAGDYMWVTAEDISRDISIDTYEPSAFLVTGVKETPAGSYHITWGKKRLYIGAGNHLRLKVGIGFVKPFVYNNDPFDPSRLVTNIAQFHITVHHYSNGGFSIKYTV